MSQDEVIVYAFNVTRLCKAIAKALEINSPQRLDQILDNAWHIGTLNLPKGKSAPVYFAIQQTFIPLGNTIEKLLLRGKEPPVILIPTMTLCPVEICGVAEDKMGHVLGLDQIVTIQPKGKAHAPLPLIQVVMSRLGDTNPPYMFMLIDDHYFLRWDGSEVAQIDRSKGFDYYRTLLQCPCTNMSALDLQTKFPDKKKKLRPLGGIDVSDDTAIKDQENELRDLMQELEKAEANGDFATRDRIKEEIAQVQGHMQRSRNIGGRPRKSLDPEEQARKNVSRAMKRALDQIPDSLAPLKEHLMKSISPSVTLRYEPPVDIPWNL